MFHTIPPAIQARMQALHDIDVRDREDGTPRVKRLRQVTPEVGQFIAFLAASAPGGRYVEIGTSAGYSTLWLALACRETGRRITTFEIDPAKVSLAKETFHLGGVEDVVELVEGDARSFLADSAELAFCFLDAEKEIYRECYEMVVPRLKTGGLLVADNAINHQATLQPMLERALQDERVDAMIVPIGKGELICRKV